VARFLVATTDFAAHVDWGGLLPTAVRLRRAGHDVLWLTGPCVAPVIERAGLDVHPISTVDPSRRCRLRESLEHDLSRAKAVETWEAAFRGRRGKDAQSQRARREYELLIRLISHSWLQEDAIVSCFEAIGAAIARWHPDVLVAEPMMLPGSLAAEASGVRLASCGYPGALLSIQGFPRSGTLVRQLLETLERVRSRVGLPTRQSGADVDLFFSATDLQIVYFPPDWFGDLISRPSPGVQFVGSSAPLEAKRQDEREARDAATPLIIIAVSSSYSPDVAVLQALFDAVERVGGSGLIGGCSEVRHCFEPLPSHITWETWLDYESVLPRASAIVHHGGLGTTHVSVRAAMPQLVLPGPIDQSIHAEAVSRFGAGLMYVGPLTADAIASRLRKILSCDRYRACALRLRDHFGAFGGVQTAADLLVALACRETRFGSMNGRD